MKINSPILYCCYNRPNNVKKSIRVLKKINAKNIYIVCDGPKKTLLDLKTLLGLDNPNDRDLKW